MKVKEGIKTYYGGCANISFDYKATPIVGVNLPLSHYLSDDEVVAPLYLVFFVLREDSLRSGCRVDLRFLSPYFLLAL